MARRSRFENLERDRPERAAEPRSTGLERFSEAAAPAPRHAAEAARSGTEPLARFTADGAQALATDDDALARLPSLECPACGLEGGKFERRCRRCDAALDGPDGRALNLRRLAAFDAERAETAARAASRRAVEIAEAVARKAEERAALVRQLDDVKHAQLEALGGAPRLTGALAGWVAIIAAAGLSVVLKGAPSAFFAVVAAALLLTQRPRGGLAWLSRRRDRTR
jgi:hypothetical protein